MSADRDPVHLQVGVFAPNLSAEWTIEDGMASIVEALRGDDEHQAAIAQTGIQVIAMLLKKNRQYGSAVFRRKGYFSRAGAEEGIRMRMDDKLGRIISRQGDDDEDPELDLLGYLVLLFAAKGLRDDA